MGRGAPSREPNKSTTLAEASFAPWGAGLQESHLAQVVPGSRGCLQGRRGPPDARRVCARWVEKTPGPFRRLY